jgi:hypothetical protein
MWKCVEKAMKNITLAMDERLIARARAFAKAKGTTLNALVREQIVSLMERDKRQESARKQLLELIDTSTAELGRGYKWNREELYEERMLPRHKHPDVRGGRK